jgi:arylsulfatase A-like enzyme
MAAAEPAAPGHNLLLLLTDQRWDSTGLGGNPLDLTPHFDRMARAGTYLPLFFTSQPVCAPARACLQTGQYATTTGVFRNGIALGGNAVTLAHCFARAGYATGYIGKWHLAAASGPSEAVPPAARGGYAYWLAANILEFSSSPYHTVVYDTEGRDVFLPGYRVDALTDAAIRFLEAHRKVPCFLMVSFVEPHHQNELDDFPPPEGYRERYAGRWLPPDLAALGGSSAQHIAGYWGMVRRLDEALGRLLDTLRSLDLAQNTIVAFTSDHGCHFRTRNAEYKRSCHESSIHVPCALRGPGFDGGGRVDELVSLVDLPPTLLAAAGLPIPATMQGRSFLPLLHGVRRDWPDDVFIQISESQVGRAVRTRRWKYAVRAPTGDAWQDPGASHYVEECLYDLEADPYELKNLVGTARYREEAAHLRQRLVRRMVQAGEATPSISQASS